MPGNTLTYWNDHHLVEPDLARFAYDMLAIPLMSDEYERVISSAKYLITDSRNRLCVDIIEISECFKKWFGRPISREDVDKSLILHDEHTSDDAIDEMVTSAGIDKVLEQIRAGRRED